MTQMSEKREALEHVGYPIEHNPLERHSNIGIILPGQDVRKIGMFEQIMESPAGREVLTRGNEWLKENYNYDLLEMAKEIPDESPEDRKNRADILRQTKYTQPAVYLASMALHNIKKHHERSPGYATTPDYITGISMGMGTAAVLAGYMDFETGLKFHAERGRIMQEESDPTPTSMVTLMGDEEKVNEYLKKPENAMLHLCIINADNLFVVGGPDDPSDPTSPMQRVRSEAKSAGFRRTMEVDTDRAMHGRYVRPARESFDKLVDSIDFKKHHSIVVSSLTGEPIHNEEDMKNELKQGFDNTIDNRLPLKFFKERKIHVASEVGSEKGFFAKFLGDHRVQAAAAIGAGVVAAGAVTAYEIMTHHHPDHPENGNKEE
ncbi:MAG: acyltransferase domain-containing protein [Candidatus Levybacteria bacterium]|nr:acyltransferase domain-containing protein [Candidatus Levybacteria bacterium]